MMFRGARVARSARDAARLDIEIQGSRIKSLGSFRRSRIQVDASDCIVVPGLINSHDHLEFNLFPRIPTGGPHPNYVAWAKCVFQPDRFPVSDHLAVPKDIRLRWGGLKNLFSGVTTVAHHNAYHPAVFDIDFPVRVLRHYRWAHSVHFTPDYGQAFRHTPKAWPFFIHAAEGTDELAAGEIYALHRAGVLSGRTVLVHAVGVEPSALPLLRTSGVGVVWCPSSNIFTLGATLSFGLLRSGLRVSLGTDSALTGEGDLIDEIGIASRRGHCTAEEIYDMVTASAARILMLDDGSGELRVGGRADLVVIGDLGLPPAKAIQEMRPKLVMVAGNIALVSAEFVSRVPRGYTKNLQPINLCGRGEYLVAMSVARLIRETTLYLGTDFRLAGRRVWA